MAFESSPKHTLWTRSRLRGDSKTSRVVNVAEVILLCRGKGGYLRGGTSHEGRTSAIGNHPLLPLYPPPCEISNRTTTLQYPDHLLHNFNVAARTQDSDVRNSPHSSPQFPPLPLRTVLVCIQNRSRPHVYSPYIRTASPRCAFPPLYAAHLFLARILLQCSLKVESVLAQLMVKQRA